ncbi:MAG: CRISPR-associated endonuclease Cas1 [Anaerolineae bacterium]|nr:CRISPR-associated endonuclease Cas1 [Anaerolineae bacterium]
MAIVRDLIVDQFGTHIGKYSKRLCVTQKGEKLAEAPLLHLENVIITGHGVSISSDALAACCERGIPVHFVSSRGEAYASLYAAALNGTIVTRRAQLEAYHDERGCRVAIAIAAGKIENQATTLKYIAKNRKETEPEIYEELRLLSGETRDHLAWLDKIDANHIDDARQAIMVAEAHAAKKYWAGVALVVPESYAWPGRQTRGAADPVNSILNYGYGVLYGQVERAIVLAGLEPYAGFIHADRPGKPSLVLDLVEEFRQVTVDRVVIGLVARSFDIEQDDRGRLTVETRRSLAGHILDRLETALRYDGQRVALRHIIQSQARRLASALRGESDYVPYKAGW